MSEVVQQEKKTKLMTEGSIFKNIFLFSIPLILGNLLQQTYNAVDSIIVGNYVGGNALAAVGASSSLSFLFIGFSQGLAVGAGVVVSQYLGAKNRQGVQSAVHTALMISGILGLSLTAAGIIFCRPLLIWMNTPENVLSDAVCYLRIFMAGSIFNVLYNMSAGILNAAGNSRRPLLYLAAAAVTNTVLDVLLIAVFHMGVAGAAIATTFSQAVSFVLAMHFLLHVPEDYRVELKKIGIEKKMALRIIQVGLPTAIQNTVISFSNVLVQSSVNVYGEAAMAGFAAYMKVDGFNILPVSSFSMATTTFVGQNYGAGRLDRVKKGMFVTLVMCIAHTIITGVLLLTFSEAVMRLFNQDPAVIAFGQTAMKYFCPFYWMLAVLHGLAGAVRGTGKSTPPMVILLVSLCLFRIFWIQMILPHFSAIDGVFMLYPVSWMLGMTLMVLYTWKGKWLPAAGKRA